jgi:hypothetical protein
LRTTVISMPGQAYSIGAATGGPTFGLIANAVSIQAALLASAVVLSPIPAVYRRLILRSRESIELGPTTADRDQVLPARMGCFPRRQPCVIRSTQLLLDTDRINSLTSIRKI